MSKCKYLSIFGMIWFFIRQTLISYKALKHMLFYLEKEDTDIYLPRFLIKDSHTYNEVSLTWYIQTS